MGSSIKLNNATRVATDNGRIAGTEKFFGTQPSILVEGVSYTPTQVVAIYQNDLDALAEVATAKLALAQAVTKAKAVAKVRNGFDKGYKQVVEGSYGNNPSTLGIFGIVHVAPKTPTAAVKAAAAEQGLALRRLRNPKVPTPKASSVVASATPAEAPTPPAVSGATGGSTPKI